MKLTFQCFDPAGNITLLVMTPVPREDYQTVAAKLLSVPELYAQEVGLHKLDIRQPGGVISTTAMVQKGKLQCITIGGKVNLGPVYDIEF